MEFIITLDKGTELYLYLSSKYKTEMEKEQKHTDDQFGRVLFKNSFTMKSSCLFNIHV